ncbi:oligopeptide transporter [Purpureocillium lavendulum]|uniref:Oligopeptide transporter n=1 Tax=Purpureocillium lavendulum TaxID=1247861 RepID=A0AB34FNC1_9HYPO|nr:oligopeptide transporter [Purpureocillium lavendulum]
MNSMDTTDVIVCGCGPTGGMVSTLLSQYGIPHVVLERDAEITADPRGIALDEDGIRCLQACGIYDKIFTEIGQAMGTFRFVGGVHNDLSRKAFMAMDYSTTEGGTGHPGFICHRQPLIEKNLRSRMQELGVADIRLNSCVAAIGEDSDWVYASYVDAQGDTKTIQGRFLVGADGKTGFTRKQYLEPRGITLERDATAPYDEVWVALNWRVSLPTPASHPHFPLWEKGFTPQQVYDAFFPKNFRFLCNPTRAAVCGRFGLEDDRLWRFEFVVLPGEDSTEMASASSIAEVVYPYITHPGSRYGLSEKEIIFPLDCIEVLRCRPFRFAARSCNKWSLGRVVLCGDAAHVFPPFGGQGIASAFRDAMSLVWRLRIATHRLPGSREPGVDYEKLLEGWYSERKQQLEKSLRSTVENGTYVTESNPIKIFVRDWYLWAIQQIPSWKHWLQLGNRRDGMTAYKWTEGKGMAFIPTLRGGRNFPQVYAKQITNKQPDDEAVHFTDDLIFASHKVGLFQVVVMLYSTDDDDDSFDPKSLAGLREISGGCIRGDEATVFLNRTEPPLVNAGAEAIYRLATADEFAKYPPICANRPYPVGYDPFRMAKEVGQRRFVVLRPDRFVFAVVDTITELHLVARMVRSLVETGVTASSKTHRE